MGTPKERKESEKHLGRLENEVRGLLSAEAAREEVGLAFTELGADREYLKLLVDKRSVGEPEGDFEITLVSGKRKRDKSFYTGGYLLAVKGASGETACLVLGSIADIDHRAVRPAFPKETVFLEVAPGEEYFTAKIGRRDWFRHLTTLEMITMLGGALSNKVNEVIGEILLGDREEIRRHLVGPNPELTRGHQHRVVVKSLSEELAAALDVAAEVKIEGFPEGFPVKVRVLLEAGARELKYLGTFLEKMTLGQTYEGKKERIFLATEGTREDGQFVVQVGEDLTTGKLNLIVGILYEKGEGRGRHTVSAMLNFENHVPVVVDASTVELAVTCDGQTIRADFSAKKESLNGYAGGGRESKAGNLLFGYFPDREYSFAKAFMVVRELTRKTFSFSKP